MIRESTSASRSYGNISRHGRITIRRDVRVVCGFRILNVSLEGCFLFCLHRVKIEFVAVEACFFTFDILLNTLYIQNEIGR